MSYFYKSGAGAAAAAVATSGLDIRNLGLSVTASANVLTVSIKQIDGSTAPSSGTGQVSVAFRSSTATSGAVNLRNITAALSQTLTQGTSLGATTAAKDMYLWLIDSDGAGTMKIGASSVLYDESSLQTTVAENQSATATNASPAVFTANAHGFGNGDSVILTGTPPTGFTNPTRYFVVNTATNTFQLSATPGGTAINSSSTGSAIVVHYAGYKMVSDAAYTSMPVRLIGKFNETFATVGNWVAPNTVAIRQQFPIREDVSVRLTNTATVISGTPATIVWTNSNANGAFDTHNSAPDKTTIVVPVTGKYQASGTIRATFTSTAGDQSTGYYILVNGTIISQVFIDTILGQTFMSIPISDVLNLNALDLVTVKFLAQQTSPTITTGATVNYISLAKISPL